MVKIFVRRANYADLREINKLNAEMHNFLAKLIGRKLSKQDLENEKTSFSELKKENYYVAILNGRIVGFVAFSKNLLMDEWYGKHIYLYEIGVAKDYRGLGIGKKLFKVALDFAHKYKANIKVDTFIANKIGIKFYKKLGFKMFSANFIFDLNRKLKSWRL